MTTLAASVARAVHRARPNLRATSGAELLADLIRRIGTDAAQRTPTSEPFATGYVRDAESTKAQRFLLRCMEGSRP